MNNELLIISIATDSHRNIGCLSLYAVAQDAGISAHLLFIPREVGYSEAAFSAFLQSHDYNVIGISLTTRDFSFARIITSHIRKCMPNAHIVWGGIHPTCKPKECLDYADSICVGEGEVFLPELIAALRDGVDISTIEGIGLTGGKEDDDDAVLVPPALIRDLNPLPFPRFDFDGFFVLDDCKVHKFGPPDYVKYSKYGGDGYVLLTSRSCPHRCSYCINSFLNRLYPDNAKRLYRRLTVDNVIKEIKHALKTIPGIGFINFMDDHFLTDSEWIREFCKKYKTLIDLPFIIRATPTTIKEDCISILKVAGLRAVQMGIQSGSEKTHKTIFHRSFDIEDVLRAANVLNQHQLVCHYDFIIENDFEADEDRDKSIELMLRLPKPYRVNLFVMTVFPETDLEAMYKERGMIPRVDPYSNNYFSFHESDFYYQLASVIPVIDENEARHIFNNRHDEQTRLRLRELFLKKVEPMS